MHLRSLVLVSLTALAGCGGGDDATGPSPVPRTANVGGSWTISITNLSGSVSGVGVSCFFTGAPMVLSQTGATFTGSYGPAELTCHAAGESVSVTSQGVVVNGTVTGDDVAFDFDTQDAHHVGTVSGNSMSGTAHYRVDVGAPYGLVTLNGVWAAARQ